MFAKRLVWRLWQKLRNSKILTWWRHYDIIESDSFKEKNSLLRTQLSYVWTFFFFKQDVSLKSYPAEGPAEDKVGLCYCHLNLKMPRSFLFCPLEKKSSWRKGDASPARPWEGADITCLWSWAFNNKLYYQSGNRIDLLFGAREGTMSGPRRGIPRGQMQDSGFWNERMFSSTACRGEDGVWNPRMSTKIEVMRKPLLSRIIPGDGSVQ